MIGFVDNDNKSHRKADHVRARPSGFCARSRLPRKADVLIANLWLPGAVVRTKRMQ